MDAAENRLHGIELYAVYARFTQTE